MNDELMDDPVPEPDTQRWGMTEFVPGEHVGLVGHLTVALIEAGHASTRDRLWGLVASDAPIDDLLDELSATGLKSLPSFAVGQLDGDDLRLVARGATRVTVTFGDGSQKEVDPSDVRTWREDVVSNVVKLSLTLDEQSVPVAADWSDRFFVLAGSVPAMSIERSFDGGSALASSAAASWERPIAPLPQSDRRAGLAGEPASAWDDHPPDVEPMDQEPVSGEPEPAAVEMPEGGVGEGDHPGQVEEERTGQVESEFQGGIDELPSPAAEVSVPPEDSNETISSIDFADAGPVPVTSTAPRVGAGPAATSADDAGAGDDNYDFIYGHTVARSVEGAAVRAADEPADAGGLISSVPGEAAPADPGLAGDHDGMTISRADLAAMTSASSTTVSPVDGHDQVLAVLCSAGHPNPLHVTNCRVCGVVLQTSAPVSVRRPPLGVLVFSNGERVVADRTVLIGRNPRVSGTLTGELPRIVKLESAGQGLSRTHAEVRVEGWQMLLEDLQSTNGTEVTLPGQAPRRLHAGDPVALVAGAVVDFGEELQCRVEAVS